jgi:two-component system cell cycle response regulator DivK
MAGEPILIIDDNPQNLKLAKVILVSEGYDVRTAIDAEEALRMLESLTPALILMDLQLPRMDGLEIDASDQGGSDATRDRDHRAHGLRDERR